jgi:glycosyltransferase involved in cell wall biosynthesis
MDQEYLVSIIMPVKNAEPWLKECLDSILSQTFDRWQLVAVNDDSTDRSNQVLEAAAKNDSRIHVFQNEGNGIIDALNTALTHASAGLITRMDADDTMPSKKLEWFVEAQNNHPNSIITGKVSYFSNGEISPGYLEYEQWLNERIDQNDHWAWVYRECVIASANWMAPKELVTFASDTYPEDYKIVLDWYSIGYEVAAVNEVTHHWREHPKRTSRNSKNYIQEAFFDLKLNHFMVNERDPGRPLMIMGKNKKAKLIKRFLKKRREDFIEVDLEHLYRFGEIENPQVLSAVFPEISVRNGISDFLGGFDLEMGRDWWWV